MIKEFEMSQEDLSVLIAACEKQKSIKKELEAASLQVNKLWEDLGRKMGFDHTATSPNGEDPAKFLASPVKSISTTGCAVAISNKLPETFDKAGYEALDYTPLVGVV